MERVLARSPRRRLSRWNRGPQPATQRQREREREAGRVLGRDGVGGRAGEAQRLGRDPELLAHHGGESRPGGGAAGEAHADHRAARRAGLEGVQGGPELADQRSERAAQRRVPFRRGQPGREARRRAPPRPGSGRFRAPARAAGSRPPDAKVRAKRQRPSDTTQAWVRSTPRSTASSASPAAGRVGHRARRPEGRQHRVLRGSPPPGPARRGPGRRCRPVSSSRRTTPTKRSEWSGWDSSTCQSQATWSRSKGMAASTS